ncbi:cellulase family glycosylhydrolase [Bradyrhizobium sp. 1(2017)]|uniref:cellulase family glycosylhydrolase n=1 Tax=Bradyrhizobium sp. 1(2017) TaxID=1404888 RepID=UPI001FEED6A8|nr:cellulase family glycosylhydrolase [Bradyrhizobium sp. 1(2017)]
MVAIAEEARAFKLLRAALNRLLRTYGRRFLRHSLSPPRLPLRKCLNDASKRLSSTTVVGVGIYLWICGTLAAAGLQNDTLAFSDSGRTLVCMNVFQPFGYGKSIGPPGSAVYTASPFENGGSDTQVLPNSRLELAKSLGFDCLRMVVDVGALMSAETEPQLDALVEQIGIGISRRIRSGLRVIVDVHPFPVGTHPVPGFADVDLIDGPDGPRFQRLIHVVRKLAQAVRDHFSAAEVAVELFNEPPPPESFRTRRAWNEQVEYYWRQIRVVLPSHTLIVAGTGYAGLDGLISGDPSAGVVNLRPEQFDANTGFAIHPYESATFTHQGYPGFFSHVRALPFPAGDEAAMRRAKEMFRNTVIDDPSLSLLEKFKLVLGFVYRGSHSYSFDKYSTEFGNVELLSKRLNVVTAWADKHHLSRRQIMNTEFGVNHDQDGCSGKASAVSAFNFIRAIRDISDASKLGLITIHQLQGDCFGIASSSPPYDFDPDIIDALRLGK